jgi:hypothetical protein
MNEKSPLLLLERVFFLSYFPWAYLFLRLFEFQVNTTRVGFATLVLG